MYGRVCTTAQHIEGVYACGLRARSCVIASLLMCFVMSFSGLWELQHPHFCVGGVDATVRVVCASFFSCLQLLGETEVHASINLCDVSLMTSIFTRTRYHHVRSHRILYMQRALCDHRTLCHARLDAKPINSVRVDRLLYALPHHEQVHTCAYTYDTSTQRHAAFSRRVMFFMCILQYAANVVF